MRKRYCKFCGELLVKKPLKRSCCKRGWGWETPVNFKRRKYCGPYCMGKGIQQGRGHIIWSKELIKEEFEVIRDKGKWNSKWLQKNHFKLRMAITNHYGKNAWRRFLKEYKKEPIYDHVNPQKKKMARAFLRYWLEPDGDGRGWCSLGKVFKWSTHWQLEGYESKPQRTILTVLNYLREKGVIRLHKRGKGGAGDSLSPNQYILLRDKV